MAAFRRFEDIVAWQKARETVKRVYDLAAVAPFSKDFGLADQIKRSTVSISANIAEGFGRRTNKDFGNFLVMAHGSAAETQSHLYIALDLGYISKDQFTEIYNSLDEISRMTMSLCQHLRNSS